ncbi:hypothetical protein [Thiothrix sp.]|jgi:hypothetical protein|uniref:hypothetical protein n=1 Tax=Thiothrix sp. TaxID=1032 RepID=UPI00257ADEC7|nr:hypothetical protein [Thiothrix sp.]
MKLLEHPNVKASALWIKENTIAINVLAGVFFLLTFFAGIFWIAGREIEPVAFVLSICASSLFGLPHLAEFIQPSRKPIKNMTHDELLEFVKHSDAEADWKGITNNWVSEVFLREDPRLRFRAKYTDEGIQNDDYNDDWANKHPNPKATGYWYDLYYDGNLIDRFILVAVDDARANLPPPDWRSGKIHMMAYKVAKIHDTLKTVDEYLARSGLEIDKNT